MKTFTSSSATTFVFDKTDNKFKTGSKEYMLAHGFHSSTPQEIKRYGKFVTHESPFSRMRSLFARLLFKCGISVSRK